MPVLRSNDNPRVRRWQKLVRESRLRRAEGRAIIEGPHLVESWLMQRGAPVCVLVSELAVVPAFVAVPVVVSDQVMRSITDVRAPQGIAAEIAIPRHDEPLDAAPACVFLDGIQDAGNVGAILRSACAFGVLDIVLGPGCADPWSPKVLRAASGAHARLRIREAADLGAAVDAFGGNTCWTTPRGGKPLADVDFSRRTGWIFGAEGAGVSAGLARHAGCAVTIGMPGETESLNVAAAAAICLYEQGRRQR